MYIKMENAISNLTKTNNVDINKGLNITMCKMHPHTHACTHTHTHTHTHTLYRPIRGEGQCCSAETFGEEKCLAPVPEERESSRVPHVQGETIPDTGAEARKSTKATGPTGEAPESEHVCI